MSWAPSYATTEELAAFVRIGDSADDAQLSLALETASRAIDQAAGRQFGQSPAPVARYYTARWDQPRHHYRDDVRQWNPLLSTPRGSLLAYGPRWRIDLDDLMTTTGLVVEVDVVGDGTYATTLPAADYQLTPGNAAANGRPWEELVVRSTSSVIAPELLDAVRVTARWGWSGIPDAIRQATLLQASRLIKRRDSPFGVAGSPEVGSELRLLAKLDPDVMVAVRPYRRVWGAV